MFFPCRPQGEIEIIGNAVDKELFYPRKMVDCREYFGLSKDITIIGTGGALDANRGINNLYRAYVSLAEKNPHIYLIVAGVGSREDPVFGYPNVVDLGVLPYQEMSLFFNVLDVAVICNQNNGFGQYCFPQKAYEILACKIPVVAADLGVMSDLLKNHPECLFNPESEDELVSKIDKLLKKSPEMEIAIYTWAEQAEKFERLFKKSIK